MGPSWEVRAHAIRGLQEESKLLQRTTKAAEEIIRSVTQGEL